MASSARISLVLLVGLGIIPFIGGEFFAYQMSLFLIYAIVTQGVGYVWSRAGILPLGQSFFFGLGAYFTAAILKHFDAALLQMLLMVTATVMIGFAGFLIAATIFKGRSVTGPFFSLITLALAMIAEQIANGASKITGGFNGYSEYGTFLGLDPFSSFYWVAALSCVGVCYMLLWLDERPAGLLTRASYENEPRLQLFGFPTHIIKAAVFGLSAGIAALGGVLFAIYQGIVTPTSLGFVLAAEFVIWTAVGGRLHPLGAIIGTILIGIISTNFRDKIEIWDVLLGLFFLIVVLRAPNGLWGLIRPLVEKYTTTIASRSNAPKINQEISASQLWIQELRVGIGGVKILNGVEFQSPESGIISIIGPNGAGKTSILNTITGNLPIASGKIIFNNQRIENRYPHYAMDSGIGRKLQVPAVFMHMSIDENMAIATMSGRMKFTNYFRKAPLGWSTKWNEELRTLPMFSFLKAGNVQAGILPQGHRQFLEFIMTSLSEPRLLLLDEPCAGLSPDETRIMSELIERYAKKFGGLVLVIEHDMSIVEAISDKVLVMHQGRAIAYGKYTEIRENPEVTAIYLGAAKS